MSRLPDTLDVASDDSPSPHSVPSAPPGDLTELQSFRDKWHAATLTSGALSNDEAPLDAAAADALAEARRAHKPAYDPVQRPDDAARERGCAGAQQTHTIESRALLNDHARLRSAQTAAAAAGCNGPKPTLRWWVAPCGIGALSGLLALSLHDLASGLGLSDAASWVLGLLLGLSLGGFIVNVQLRLVELPGIQRGVFWGGLTVAAAIALMRMTVASDAWELATGLALGGAECGLLVILERVAHAYRTEYARWAAHHAPIADAATACAAREERIRGAGAVIAERNATVADRARRSDLAALEDVYLHTARAAVLEGIAHNRARILGGGV